MYYGEANDCIIFNQSDSTWNGINEYNVNNMIDNRMIENDEILKYYFNLSNLTINSSKAFNLSNDSYLDHLYEDEKCTIDEQTEFLNNILTFYFPILFIITGIVLIIVCLVCKIKSSKKIYEFSPEESVSNSEKEIQYGKIITSKS